MTERHHVGEGVDVLGLEDADAGDPEEASELLDGLLGPDAAERDDVPTGKQPSSESAGGTGSVEETAIGRWACRFCETERRKPSGLAVHHATCPDSQFYREHHWQTADTDESDPSEAAEETDEQDHASTNPVGKSLGEQRTYLLDTQWHEFRAYLKFAEHGLKPYYALHDLMERVDWSDGRPTRTIGYDDREYRVTFDHDDSPLRPCPDASLQTETVPEFQLHLETADGLRRANFSVRPRWPNMESKDGMPTPSNPREMVGVDVDTQGANHAPHAYPELLDLAMQAFDINGGSSAPQDRYLTAANVEPWSIVIDGEQYVRIHKDHSGPLIGLNGPLERMNRVLASDRSGYRKRIADDRETAGAYHTVTFDSRRAGKILEGHRLAKTVKHYHVKHPEALDEDDPLRHPKLGVSYHRSRSETRVYWDREALESDERADPDAIGLEAMARELDEQLLNTLRWAGLPTRPDRQVFVDDSVFEVSALRRERTLIPDPLPQLADKQEHMVTRAITKMCDPERYDTDARVIESLLSDGGTVAPKGLAADLGVHYETILRSLKRLEDIVVHSYGSVELKSQHLAQQLAERAGDLLGDFGWLEEHVGQLAEKATQLVDGTASEEDSPFELWVQKYLEDIDDPERDPRVYLRMGYRPEDTHEARGILKSGLTALRTTFGSKNADASVLARKAQAEIHLIDGTPVYMEFAPEVT